MYCDIHLFNRSGGTGTPNAYVGGLVGRLSDGNGRIRYSFSRGQVIAQSIIGTVNAGGIVGERAEGEVHNTAALGSRVVAAGPTARAGRIAGVSGTPVVNLSNNYSDNLMLTGTGTYVAMTDFQTASRLSVVVKIARAGVGGQ